MCKLNNLVSEIWDWCTERKIHLSISYVAGTFNTEVDELSRKINDDL